MAYHYLVSTEVSKRELDLSVLMVQNGSPRHENNLYKTGELHDVTSTSLLVHSDQDSMILSIGRELE